MIEPTDGSREVKAGIPVPLADVPTPIARADITADHENAGDVWIGTSAVSSIKGQRTGRRLRPGDVLTVENTDLALWWIDGSNTGDTVYWGAEVERGL